MTDQYLNFLLSSWRKFEPSNINKKREKRRLKSHHMKVVEHLKHSQVFAHMLVTTENRVRTVPLLLCKAKILFSTEILYLEIFPTTSLLSGKLTCFCQERTFSCIYSQTYHPYNSIYITYSMDTVFIEGKGEKT